MTDKHEHTWQYSPSTTMNGCRFFYCSDVGTCGASVKAIYKNGGYAVVLSEKRIHYKHGYSRRNTTLGGPFNTAKEAEDFMRLWVTF